MKKGRCGTMTHDYIGNGTAMFFPALNVFDGKVIGCCVQQHRHQEFIRLLNAVEAAVPAGKLIHAVADNYATHERPEVCEWLARHPRWTCHFIPTSAPWLNAVEGYIAKLTRRRLKRGVFRSIVQHHAAIKRFLAQANADPRPFRWTKDPDNGGFSMSCAAAAAGRSVPPSTARPRRSTRWARMGLPQIQRVAEGMGRVSFRCR